MAASVSEVARRERTDLSSELVDASRGSGNLREVLRIGRASCSKNPVPRILLQESWREILARQIIRFSANTFRHRSNDDRRRGPITVSVRRRAGGPRDVLS